MGADMIWVIGWIINKVTTFVIGGGCGTSSMPCSCPLLLCISFKFLRSCRSHTCLKEPSLFFGKGWLHRFWNNNVLENSVGLPFAATFDRLPLFEDWILSIAPDSHRALCISAKYPFWFPPHSAKLANKSLDLPSRAILSVLGDGKLTLWIFLKQYWWTSPLTPSFSTA